MTLTNAFRLMARWVAHRCDTLFYAGYTGALVANHLVGRPVPEDLLLAVPSAHETFRGMRWSWRGLRSGDLRPVGACAQTSFLMAAAACAVIGAKSGEAGFYLGAAVSLLMIPAFASGFGISPRGAARHYRDVLFNAPRKAPKTDSGQVPALYLP